MTDAAAYAEQNLPGILDPRRIGTLAWEERPLRPQQDQVLLRIIATAEQYLGGSDAFTKLGLVMPASTARKSELAVAEVLAVGPGKRVSKGPGITGLDCPPKSRGSRCPMLVSPGMRVLVEGDCGWIIGPNRMVRQGAILGVVE